MLLVPMLLLVFGVQAQDAEVSELVAWPDLGGREIVVAVENLYPPYNYLDDNGNGVGWDYDTFRDICALLNCVPVFQEMTWESILAAIGSGSSGEFDVAADGITYTPERDQTADFSILYQAYDETLLVRGGEDRFTTSAELIALGDYLVGTQTGTTNATTALNLFGEEHVSLFEDFGAAVQALLNDDVDAIAVDRPAAEGYTETYQGQVKTLEESISGIQGLAFAFPAGSDLIHPINAAMSALMASGRWDETYIKWFETE
jgi:polar amino acid transport system substrate-binding protein